MTETPSFKHRRFQPIMQLIGITSILIMCAYALCMAATIAAAMSNLVE